jgi:hypothetical protein
LADEDSCSIASCNDFIQPSSCQHLQAEPISGINGSDNVHNAVEILGNPEFIVRLLYGEFFQN